MHSNIKTKANPWITAAANLYFFFLFTWFALYVVFGDSNGYLGLANALAIYFFLPLPIIAFIALRIKMSRLIYSSAVALVIFLLIWGSQLLPKSSQLAENQPSLRVMTFNILGRAGNHEPVLQAIREEDPDLLFLQELTPDMAIILREQLSEVFPHYIFEPASRSRGHGVMSKYPLEETNIVLDGNWTGIPQILTLQWQETEITLVNFHTIPTASIWPRWVDLTFDRRELALQNLANFAAQQAQFGPLIVAGDANTTRLSDAYKSVAEVLQDSWLEAGFGFGHSFPGPYEEGKTFAQISIFRLPYWMVSIDYIFHSTEMSASRTWMGAYYGGTDHRSVVTELFFHADS
jgi:endonuclease/exonuclease/phosphatase (EEP) superfamily protein YafD